MSLMLHGDSPTIQRTEFDQFLTDYGHWVIYRRYDLSSKSIYVDDATNEGVDGPRWNYSDIPTLIRHDPASVRSTAGLITDVSKIFLSYKIVPKRGDVIIELNYDGENRYLTPGLIMEMDHREAYEIEDVAQKRGAGGALIYSVCVVRPKLEAY